VKLVASIVGALALASGVPSSWHTLRDDGIVVRYPPTWSATSRSLTPVSFPAQALAVASYRLPRDSTGADGCRPSEALDRLPPAGAFVYGWDYGSAPHRSGFRKADFPPRPRHFRLAHFARYECAGPSYMLRVRQAGRFIQVHVALGPRAKPSARVTVLRILDSLRIR
jgi:hypothetical protein